MEMGQVMTGKRLGSLLRYYRIKRGITQRVMAKQLNLEPSNLSSIEAGKQQPRGNLTLKILEILLPSLKSDILLLEANMEQFK